MIHVALFIWSVNIVLTLSMLVNMVINPKEFEDVTIFEKIGWLLTTFFLGAVLWWLSYIWHPR